MPSFKFTIADAMRAAGYEGLPGGAEAIRRAELKEQLECQQTCCALPRFESMAEACDYLAVDDSGSAPCLTTFPQFDIGHEEIVNIGGPFNGIPHLVYATIDKGGRQSCRATAFPAWWRGAE